MLELGERKGEAYVCIGSFKAGAGRKRERRTSV